MPPRIQNTVTAGGQGYQDPFIGRSLDHTLSIATDITALSDDEIDSGGYLIPGLPLNADGELLGAGDYVAGVVPEATKVAAGNDATSIAAALAAHPVIVCNRGNVSRDAMEYNLGRSLTAEEIAGFTVAGSQLTLLQ